MFEDKFSVERTEHFKKLQDMKMRRDLAEKYIERGRFGASEWEAKAKVRRLEKDIEAAEEKYRRWK